MAGPRIRCNAGEIFIDNSGTPVPTPAVSYALIPAPAQTPVPTEALTPVQALTPTPAPILASVPGLPGRYTDKDL